MMHIPHRTPVNVQLRAGAVMLAGTVATFAALALAGDVTVAAIGTLVCALTLLATVTILRLQGWAPAAADPEAGQARSEDRPGPASDACVESAASRRDEEARRTAGTLDALASYLQELPGFCDVLKEHARNVIRDTEQASYSFVQSLQDIDKKIKDLKNFLTASQSDLNTDDQLAAGKTESNLELVGQIESSFHENSQLIECIIEERRAFSGVVETMRRLHGEVRVINDIAGKIKLLSLNASIEAARAAEGSGGFGVIAREIRDLSDQTRKATSTLSTLIDKACKSVEEFAADHGVEARLRAQLQLLARMQVHLGSVSETYRHMLDHEHVLASKTESHSADIEHAICKALGTLQFQDIVRQQLEGIIAALDDLHDAVRQTGTIIRDEDQAGGPDQQAIKALIGRLRDRYVMSQQRTAHASVVGDGHRQTRTGGPAIELF